MSDVYQALNEVVTRFLNSSKEFPKRIVVDVINESDWDKEAIRKVPGMTPGMKIMADPDYKEDPNELIAFVDWTLSQGKTYPVVMDFERFQSGGVGDMRDVTPPIQAIEAPKSKEE